MKISVAFTLSVKKYSSATIPLGRRVLVKDRVLADLSTKKGVRSEILKKYV